MNKNVFSVVIKNWKFFLTNIRLESEWFITSDHFWALKNVHCQFKKKPNKI